MLQSSRVYTRTSLRGFTLLEALLSVAILGIVVFSFLTAVQRYSELNRAALYRTVGSDIAEQELEIASLIPYDDIGTISGYPVGILPDTKTVNHNGEDYIVTTLVEYIDDQFDGDVFGCCSKPVDTAPADYKKIEVQVCWTSLTCHNAVRATTTLAPPGLEGDSDTGALLVQVFDSSGLPIPLADVEITNPTLAPAFSYTTTTDIDGRLLLLNLLPALNSYEITVSKVGYSTDQTYASTAGNPNPLKPHASVIIDDVTSVSFFIDPVSNLTLSTIDAVCTAVPDITLHLRGSKLLGSSPDVYKYDQDIALGSTGTTTLTNLDADTYTLTMISSEYDIGGTNIPQTFQVLPGSTMLVDITAVIHESQTLLVTVKDAITKLALSEANIQVVNSTASYDETKIAGRGTWQQLDWSGGSGQADFFNPTRYFVDNGTIDTSTSTQVRLVRSSNNELFAEDFTSTAYADVAQTTAEWETSSGRVLLPEDSDNPGSYLTVAAVFTTTLNANTGIINEAVLTPTQTLNGQTITYALSADGGLNYEEVTPGVPHAFSMTGGDLRMRAILATTDVALTPELDHVLINYAREEYAMNGTLESSSFNAGAQVTPRSLAWEPLSQNPSTGEDAVRIQIASNNDNLTWDYLGPDATEMTYYTTPNTPISSTHADARYFRYKIFLQTADNSVSPLVSSMGVTYGDGCIPAGQAFFSPLPGTDDYTVTVTLAGYDTQSQVLNINGNSNLEFSLIPN